MLPPGSHHTSGSSIISHTRGRSAAAVTSISPRDVSASSMAKIWVPWGSVQPLLVLPYNRSHFNSSITNHPKVCNTADPLNTDVSLPSMEFRILFLFLPFYTFSYISHSGLILVIGDCRCNSACY